MFQDLVSINISWGPHGPVRRNCFYAYLTDEEAEAQRSYVICFGSLSTSESER